VVEELKEEAFIRNETGEWVNVYCANRSASEVSRKNSAAQMSTWLTSGRTVMLRTTYPECLVFHACSETIPTNVLWLFSVLPDKHWVRIFLKWHKARLAYTRHSVT